MVVAGVGVAAVVVGASVAGGDRRRRRRVSQRAARNAPSAAPSGHGASRAPGRNSDGWKPRNDGNGGRGMMAATWRPHGRPRHVRRLTITGITGWQVALKTADGWTGRSRVRRDGREGGKAATLADLKVGDQVRFQQTRNADGTYKVTAIAVVEPHVAGTVAAVNATSITITQFDGPPQRSS